VPQFETITSGNKPLRLDVGKDLLVGKPVEVDERLADAGEEAGDGGVDGVDEDEGEDAVADAELSHDVNL